MSMPVARQFADHRSSSQIHTFAQAHLIATGDDAPGAVHRRSAARRPVSLGCGARG